MEQQALNELVRRVPQLAAGRVLVIGDVMLDSYLIGDARRISPEAPVPVVQVEEVRHLLGGAGNVARNITALGGHAALLSVVGADDDGRRVEGMLRDALVEASLIRSDKRPTTVKTRVLARNQQMIRLDREESRDLSEYCRQALLSRLAAVLAGYDVLVISDYGKGVVDSRLLPDLAALGHAQGREKAPKILVDPKPKNRACYHGAYLMTPNTRETGELAGLPVSCGREIALAGHALRRELQVENVLTTLGADGMALFYPEHGQDGEEGGMHIATTARQVFDVTGAGDTVIASIALALSAGFSLTDACILANYAAGVVVGKVGASTASLEELSAAIGGLAPEISHWKTEPEA